MDLEDTYKTFHTNTQTQKTHRFFPTAYGTFSKINHTLEHKGSLNRYKKIEISLCLLSSDHHRLKLVVNNGKNRYLTNPCKPNNSLLNEKPVKRQIKEEIFKILELNLTKTQYNQTNETQ